MLPLNIVMPATNRLAASVFFGATELVRRRTPEWMSYQTKLLAASLHIREEKACLVVCGGIPVRDSGGIRNLLLQAMRSEGA